MSGLSTQHFPLRGLYVQMKGGGRWCSNHHMNPHSTCLLILILSFLCSSLVGTCVTLLCICGPLRTVNRQRRALSDIVSAQTKFRSEKVSSERSASTRGMSLILNSLQSPVLALLGSATCTSEALCRAFSSKLHCCD